jgi:hypothetical protein
MDTIFVKVWELPKDQDAQGEKEDEFHWWNSTNRRGVFAHFYITGVDKLKCQETVVN